MKRLFSLLVLLILFLAACGNYEGIVDEKTDASFFLVTPSEDSEAESPTQEIHLTDQTIFSGAISSFEELKVGDRVRVIPFDTPSDFQYILASEVIAE